MPIDFSCPTCHAKFRVTDDQAGIRGKCPKCNSQFSIAEQVISATPIQPPQFTTVSSPSPANAAIGHRNLVVFAVGLVSGVLFVATLRTDSIPLVYIHYAGLIVLLLSIAWWTVSNLRRQWLWLIALPIVAGLVFAWWHFDYNYVEWTDVVEGDTVHYRDWTPRTLRGSAWPYYRRADWTNSHGEQYSISRFTRYGKEHGMQTHHVLSLKEPQIWKALGYDQDGDNGFYKHQWFWYGEEITEGDWYLRIK